MNNPSESSTATRVLKGPIFTLSAVKDFFAGLSSNEIFELLVVLSYDLPSGIDKFEHTYLITGARDMQDSVFQTIMDQENAMEITKAFHFFAEKMDDDDFRNLILRDNLYLNHRTQYYDSFLSAFLDNITKFSVPLSHNYELEIIQIIEKKLGKEFLVEQLSRFGEDGYIGTQASLFSLMILSRGLTISDALRIVDNADVIGFEHLMANPKQSSASGGSSEPPKSQSSHHASFNHPELAGGIGRGVRSHHHTRKLTLDFCPG